MPPMSEVTEIKLPAAWVRPLKDRFLNIDAVCRETSRCRSGIYEMVKNSQFPRPRKIGARRVGWLASEVDQWVASREAA